MINGVVSMSTKTPFARVQSGDAIVARTPTDHARPSDCEALAELRSYTPPPRSLPTRCRPPTLCRKCTTTMPKGNVTGTTGPGRLGPEHR